ncbi:MAG TPA: Rnf-Nqr domain containing protein [Desulfurivibrionaceae bacterium]|nr:Rnf-Nqr domain containing protein [Desulfurivibrionaceae bacterium]
MKTLTMLRRALPATLLLLLLPTLVWAGAISDQRFGTGDEIVLTFAAPPEADMATDPLNYSVHEEADPDIRLTVAAASLGADGRTVTLKFAQPLNTLKPHMVTVAGLESIRVAKSYFGYLLGVLISAMLINNFVFTKYLGLCVFFGTSKRKDTAKGMGLTFTIVMVVSAIMSWFFYQFILKPFQLNFLQIVIFIGLVSLTVQAVDTVLRKVNPVLFNAFGVYLVLVIANCVILAVPLILADNEYNFFETFMLSLGAGGGFMLALYLMASVRERLELANVPRSFKGVPIAFIVAGQFALAFLGFSGLSIF